MQYRVLYVRCCLALLLVLSVLTSIATAFVAYAYSVDIDAYAKVVYVVDGDTIDVVVLKVYDSKYYTFLNKKIRIRFADIDAPEIYTYEGKERLQLLEIPIDLYTGRSSWRASQTQST